MVAALAILGSAQTPDPSRLPRVERDDLVIAGAFVRHRSRMAHMGQSAGDGFGNDDWQSSRDGFERFVLNSPSDVQHGGVARRSPIGR